MFILALWRWKEIHRPASFSLQQIYGFKIYRGYKIYGKTFVLNLQTPINEFEANFVAKCKTIGHHFNLNALIFLINLLLSNPHVEI